MNDITSAEKILQELGITKPKEIDLDAIAFTQNVIIKYRQIKGCEAQIIGRNNSAIISVNSSLSYSRKRFSIAHELGHWNNDRGQTFFCTSEDISNMIFNSRLAEKMANRFAANLLLPDYMLKPILKKIPNLTWGYIKKVATHFCTSLTATAIRIIESNYLPAIVFFKIIQHYY